MAVTSTSRKITYLGNDAATSFPFAFKVFTAADMYVLREDPSGNLTLLVLGSDYNVNLNANQDTNPGGAVTLIAGPLAANYRMTLTSDVAELQQVVLTNLGGFFPDVLNTVFDRLTILVQQLQVNIDRAIKFSLTEDLTTVDLPSGPQRAGKFMYFGSDGGINLISAVPPVSGGVSFAGPVTGTKDGVNTVFTLTNGGSALGVTPLRATVWNNFPLIPGVPFGYDLGPAPGQVTYRVAPTSEDQLYATGEFTI